jgi:Yip1 domain
MNAIPVSVPSPEPAPLSQGARIVDTFIAPSKTFTDLRRSAAWWAPFLLFVIVSLSYVYTVGKKVGFQQAAENQVQMSPKAQRQLDQMSPAQREQNMEIRAKFTRYISYSAPAWVLLWWVIVAAILLGTFKLGAGATDLTFGATLAVVVYASLPHILRDLLAIVSLMAGASPDSFSLQNPVATNLGYFLSPSGSPFLYSLGSAVDILVIWTLILTAIGLSCVSKLKRSAAFAGVFGWYVLVTLIGAGAAAAFS